jgi:hypothetical protein
MQYNYSKKMFTRRAKTIQITGDLDNQRLDKWSSTVCVSVCVCVCAKLFLFVYLCGFDNVFVPLYCI